MENNLAPVTTNQPTVKTREPPDRNRVVQIDPATGLIVAVHESAYRASETVKYSCKRIKMVCRGTLKRAGGFYWCYENRELQRQYNVCIENYNQG